ncbi:V-set domain-containing T-cell activation inhibitor 1, partial [Nibea albiflora]
GVSSTVQSTNTSPIGNLSDDVLLSCYLVRNGQQVINDISVTWRKANLTGLVYKYENGAPDLTEQHSQFKGRTLLFLDKLMAGNASLLLKGVRKRDRGEYTCSISYSEGGGGVNIYLRTAGFLAAQASWWFPKPNVTWSDYDGNALLGNSILTESSPGIYNVVSMLQPVNTSGTYTCSIENNLVIVISQATVIGTVFTR